MHQLIKDAKGRMDKTIEALRSELAKIRTGKATTVLLDGIKVDYYGNMVPIKSGWQCFCSGCTYTLLSLLGKANGSDN
ncbi:MAG: hypothetical protein MZV64_39095 [Ignavibacteriales bacterium]|nr:hypothetical protein [Ignavibacteriales bacterium]